MIRVERCDDERQWDEIILDNGGHPLQLWGWGALKAAHNWKTIRIMVLNDKALLGAAQILVRTLPKPFMAMAYIPRGPVGTEEHREVVLEELTQFARRELRAVVLTIEPDWTEMPALSGWKQSSNTILIPRTLILDLTKTEDELLAAMSKKTRQYIRKSGSEPITIRQVKGQEALDKCLTLYKQTAERAGFRLHGDDYYRDVFMMLGEHSPIFAAFEGDDPIAFLWLAISEKTSFELYGGMNDRGQQLRANYALKWYAIRMTKQWGIARYDFNGLLNDGVSTFKQGFADHETMLAGTYDHPLSPLYAVWAKGLPAVKRVVRLIKR